MTTHTLSVLVENKPGVLAHVAGLFSRRAFNISSLSVGPTSDPRVSRMTIVVDGASTPVDQVHKQLEKLIRVLKVEELHTGAAVERELALIKVMVQPELRSQLLDTAAAFRANVVDLGPQTLVLEAVCSPGRLDSLLALLERHGTCELVRTGLIAIGRGGQTITDDMPGNDPRSGADREPAAVSTHGESAIADTGRQPAQAAVPAPAIAGAT
jgi:acetolactate synthase I/III small subunit